MGNVLRCCAFAAVLGLAGAASAQNAPGEAEPAEIIVKGQRDMNRQISKFVDALTPTHMRGQLKRFESGVCPQVVGFTPRQNLAVAARMRAVAKAAGISVADEECRPNSFVVVAENQDAVVKAIRSNWVDALGDRVKVPKKSGPAVLLHLVGYLDGNGIDAGVKQKDGDVRSDYLQVEVFGSSRIKPSLVEHYIASAMIVEPEAIEGLTTTQLADYAAMRLFTQADPANLDATAPPTILSALEAPMGSAVPLTLTAWDFNFLKAFYASTSGSYASSQRAQMRKTLKKELSSPAPESE